MLATIRTLPSVPSQEDVGDEHAPRHVQPDSLIKRLSGSGPLWDVQETVEPLDDALRWKAIETLLELQTTAV